MGTKLFLNLPVKDLKRSMEFFSKLGFTFNPQFTDDKAACMIIGEDNYIMLVVEKFFQTFTPKKICDTRTNAETIVALSWESRDKIDETVRTALAAGGKTYPESQQDHGYMYERGFQDVDGHLWALFYMDMSKVPAHPQAGT